MPALPWVKGQHTGDGELHVFTSRLPLKRYRDVPRFLMWTLRIRKQLAAQPGCAGYALDAKLLTKTFWTLSAWSDADAMNEFVRSGFHATMLADMAGRLGTPVFVSSATQQSDLPLDWASARTRVQNAT
jgi:hypothetical protein